MNRLTRRGFLRRSARAGAGLVLGSLPLLNRCKSGSPSLPENPNPPSVPVTLQFKVYNHALGLRGSFTKTGIMSGTLLTLSIPALLSDLGIRDVDGARIAVRNENFGRLIKYVRDVSVYFEVPSTNTSYDIFLFNNSSAVPLYNWQDDLNARWNNWNMMYTRYPLRYYRKDYGGLTGEERVWGGELLPETGQYGVFDQMNTVLQPAWAAFKYGGFIRDPSGTSGDSSYGFGNFNGAPYWNIAHDLVVVNPGVLTAVPDQVGGGMAAIVDSLIGWNDVGGAPTDRTIQANGALTEAGRDYLAFLFVRDKFARNFT